MGYDDHAIPRPTAEFVRGEGWLKEIDSFSSDESQIFFLSLLYGDFHEFLDY